MYSWVFHGQHPLLPEDDIEMVTLGIGQLVADAGTTSSPKGISTSENLPAAALFNWLDNEEKDMSLRIMVNDRLSDIEPTVRGFALENSLVYLFWKAFSVPTPLEDVFDIKYLPPSWKGEKARLVNVCRNYSTTGLSVPLEKGLTSRLAWRTETIKGSLAWFETGGSPNLRVPFLRPDNLFGPDLIFVLLLASGVELLVSVQSKAWSGKHGEGTFLEEAFKLSPERFHGQTAPVKEKNKDSIEIRMANIQRALDNLLLPSSLDMSAPGVDFCGKSQCAYDKTPPKYPVLRVFAAYEGSYTLPDMTPGSMGRYPLAVLSQGFLSGAGQLLPSLNEAAKAASRR